MAAVWAAPRFQRRSRSSLPSVVISQVIQYHVQRLLAYQALFFFFWQGTRLVYHFLVPYGCMALPHSLLPSCTVWLVIFAKRSKIAYALGQALPSSFVRPSAPALTVTLWLSRLVSAISPKVQSIYNATGVTMSEVALDWNVLRSQLRWKLVNFCANMDIIDS